MNTSSDLIVLVKQSTTVFLLYICTRHGVHTKTSPLIINDRSRKKSAGKIKITEATILCGCLNITLNIGKGEHIYRLLSGL